MELELRKCPYQYRRAFGGYKFRGGEVYKSPFGCDNPAAPALIFNKLRIKGRHVSGCAYYLNSENSCPYLEKAKLNKCSNTN